MDAFFAQIEQLKNPALRGKPLIVGGAIGNRGVVATCSYEARKFGIHSAMSAAKARRLCPHAIFIGGNLTSYVYYSTRIIDILHKFSPIVEPTSIDEAYIDITESLNLYRSAVEIAQAIKDQIYDTLCLTCSIGVAENKLLAKTASDMNKPDGLTTLWSHELEEKFFPMPVRKLRGVGPQTEKVLVEWGIRTIADLKDYPPKKLKQKFGVYGEHLHKIASGRSDAQVVAWDDIADEKSMSHEHTLYEDSSDIDFLKSLMLTLTDKVVIRLKRDGFLAKTVRIRLRYSDFTTLTREITLPELIDDVESIYSTALSLFEKNWDRNSPVRLIGVGVTNLHKYAENPQIDLFNENMRRKKRDCGDVVESIRDKFGKYSIMRAGSLPFRSDY